MFHARDGAIFSKNSTFVFFDGASPITENGIQLRSPSPIMVPDGLLELCYAGLRWSGLTMQFFRAVADSLNLSIRIYTEFNEFYVHCLL